MGLDYPTLAKDLNARGYTPAGDPSAAAAAMNAVAPVAVVGSVPMPTVLIWAGLYGVMAPITARSTNAGDAKAQSAAQSFLLALQGGYPALDMGNPGVQQMIGAFVAAGDVSADAQAALVGLATARAGYVQSTYGVPDLTEHDVAAAWAAIQPTGGN